MTLLSNLGITEIFCNFKLLLERKTDKDIPESSRLEFLEKFLTNNFGLSDAEDSTFRTLLPFLRTLLAFHQKPREQNFWDLIDSFVYYHMQVWLLQEPFCGNY